MCSHLSAILDTQPFQETTTMTTKEKYGASWASFLAFVINGRSIAEDERHFSLTEEQETEIDRYTQIIAGNPTRAERYDAIIYLSYALLAHTMGSSQAHLHPLIAFSILHNINPNNIFASPENVSPFLAGLQYYARTVIFVHSRLLSSPKPDGLPVPSLFDAVRAEHKWLKEGEDTVFAWIRQMLHLTGAYSHHVHRLPRFVWGKDDGKSYSFDGHRIKVDSVRKMIRASIRRAHKSFTKLWKELDIPPDILIEDPIDVCDNISDRCPNYSFVRDQRNYTILENIEKIRKRVLDSNTYCKVKNGTVYWDPGRMNKLLSMTEQFVKDLAVAMYLTGGQPPRGSELMATLLCNITGRPRNAYVINGDFVNVGLLNKTTFTLHQDKLIPRKFPPLLSAIIINYITFIRPIEHMFHLHSPNVDESDAQKSLTHLFYVNKKELGTDQLTNHLKKLTLQYLHCEYGTADLRQQMIYWGMRFVKPSEKGEEGTALMDLQAGHSTGIARRWYGVETERLSGTMTSDMLHGFLGVSEGHHIAFNLMHMGTIRSSPAEHVSHSH